MNHKGVRLPAALLQPPENCRHVLVCLPYQGVPILLSLSERLEWDTTWLANDGGQATLTDDERATIDAIIGGLNCPMCTDAIVNAIDALRQEIANVQIITNNNISHNCGCDGGASVTITYPPDATPDNPYLPPLTDGELLPFIDPVTEEPNPAIPLADGQTIDEKRCQVANQIWYDIYMQLDISEFVVGIGLKIAYLIEILTGVGIIEKVAKKFGGSVLADLASNLIEMIGVDTAIDAVFTGGKTYLEDNQQEIVCAFYNSPDIDSYKAQVDAVINAAYLSVASSVLSEVPLAKYTFLVEKLASIYRSIVAYYWVNGDNDYSPPSPIDCANCIQGNVLISDDFATDTVTNGVLWTANRWPYGGYGAGEYAEGNAIDIAPAQLRVTGQNMANWGGVAGLCHNMRVSFDYAVMERNVGTNSFVFAALREDTGLLTNQTIDVSTPAIGAWQSVSFDVPFVVDIQASGTATVLQFAISTTTARLRVAVDNIVITGDVS